MSTDAYLKSKYGITLAEKEAIMRAQGNACAVCKLPFEPGVRTEVDHEHFKLALMPSIVNGIKGWYSHAIWKSAIYTGPGPWAKTKKAATKLGKKFFLRVSVRGVLCGGKFKGCNRKLGRLDDPYWLLAAHLYLKQPPALAVLFSVQNWSSCNEDPATPRVVASNPALAAPYGTSPAADPTRLQQKADAGQPGAVR